MRLKSFSDLDDKQLELRYKAVSAALEKKLAYLQQIQAEIDNRKVKKNIPDMFKALAKNNDEPGVGNEI